MKFDWERIKNYHTFRAKVFGGWVLVHSPLQKQDIFDEGESMGTSMVFIPDPNHEWEIEKD